MRAPKLPPKPKLPPLPSYSESAFQAALLGAIQATPGLRAWRQQAGAIRVKGGYMTLGPTGCGDLVGTAAPDGLHWELEVKGASTQVQPGQDPWALETQAAGAVYVRARPVRGETLPEAVRRSVAELLEAIAECRSRRGHDAALAAGIDDAALLGLLEAGEAIDYSSPPGSAGELLELIDALPVTGHAATVRRVERCAEDFQRLEDRSSEAEHVARVYALTEALAALRQEI